MAAVEWIPAGDRRAASQRNAAAQQEVAGVPVQLHRQFLPVAGRVGLIMLLLAGCTSTQHVSQRQSHRSLIGQSTEQSDSAPSDTRSPHQPPVGTATLAMSDAVPRAVAHGAQSAAPGGTLAATVVTEQKSDLNDSPADTGEIQLASATQNEISSGSLLDPAPVPPAPDDSDPADDRDLADPISADETATVTSTAGIVQPGTVTINTAATGSGPTQPIELNQVIEAIYQAYPLLQIALVDRNIAYGDNLSAQGAFDLKLKAETHNTPEGFFETYRHNAGFDQPLYGGSNLFGGYKQSSGSFEPWYLERETNDAGEFELGLSVPFWQNRVVDQRRADLWRTAYGRQLVEPEIRTQLLKFVREGSIAYWEWVAAGLQYRFALELLELAEDRDEQLRKQVARGARAEADLTDNERLIVSRRVKQLDALRKVQATAAKLSLYLRLADGQPFVPGLELLPDKFPEPTPVAPEFVIRDIGLAQSRRPELQEFDLARQILNVDLNQARNEMLPELQGIVSASKDIGGPSSSSRNKSPAEIEAGLVFSVPVQRRKARGKLTAIEGKLTQLMAKRQFAEDKISIEVQAAVIDLNIAYQAIAQAHEAIRLNQEMEAFELLKLERGDSDFLRLNLREQATFDARVTEIDALLRYFEAQSDYRAALAADLPEVEFDPNDN